MTDITRGTRPWAAVLSVAVGTFAMVTTEFLPIGLLSHIAEEFAIAPGQAGTLVTTPGVVAAITAPIVTVTAGKIDRRLLLIGFSTLILLSNLIVAFAHSFQLAVAGRALLGVSVGGFWTFAGAVGRRLVNDRSGDRATSIIMAGISVGTVVGVPLGTAIGGFLGWRAAFIAVSAICLAVIVAQSIVLPRIEMLSAQTLKGMLSVSKNRALLVGLAAAALVAGGHFTAYTYLEPHLVEDIGANTTSLGLLLSIYGAAGVIGTFLGERLTRRDASLGFIASALVLAASIVMSVVFARSFIGEDLAVLLWGLSFGAIPVCVQIFTYRADEKRFETSSALTVTVFQIALAAGAFTGGMISDGYGFSAAFLIGAALCLACAVLLFVHRTASPRGVAEGAEPTVHSSDHDTAKQDRFQPH